MKKFLIINNTKILFNIIINKRYTNTIDMWIFEKKKYANKKSNIK